MASISEFTWHVCYFDRTDDKENRISSQLLSPCYFCKFTLKLQPINCTIKLITITREY